MIKLTTNQLIGFNLLYIFLGILGFLFYWNPWVFLVWIIFAIGNGTVGHRYFAHESFKVSKFTHWILSFWCTLSAYSPPLYWQVQHRHHHRHTDKETDIHSPTNGLLMSLGGWTLSKQRIESIFIDRASIVNHARAKKDNAIRFTSEWFILINLCFLVVLSLLQFEFVFLAGMAFLLESVRLGLINSICHRSNFLGNYRNHNTADNSQNNLILGILFLGFGWHNNHHADAGKLILTERWWEIDIEGLIGRGLSHL